MKLLKRTIALATLFAMLGASTTAFAVDENAFRETFTSAFYGLSVGALVGTALMVFTRKPADHLDYIGFGAAAGALAGTVYGVARSARSFASIENGSVKIAMPTIIPDLVESPATRQMNVSFRADILRGTFN